MTTDHKKHVFGPVPSRRLGFSLGIDIIPLKTCTFNCIYCQLFQTSKQTIERKIYFNLENIIQDIKEVINKHQNIDYLTFSGSGEPTLNLELGKMINQVKTFTDIPVAVITNSTLLWDPQVRKDLSKADLVVPSVDCVTEKSWQKLNRPVNGLTISMLLDGVKAFCREYAGKIWLEIMIVKDINDDMEELKKLAAFVNNLDVDKIQLNTVVRPPNETYAQPVSREFLEEILPYFSAETEIIASFKKVATASSINDKSTAIIELLTRRPCKPQEMADSLGVNLNELSKYLQQLEINRKIIREESGYYSIYH